MNTQALTITLVIAVLALSGVAQALTCFGVDSGDSSVCSGHGTCTATDTCSCFTAYSGSNCSQLVCGWSDGSLGAPQPTISATVTSDLRVVITVTMAKKVNVQHTIGLTEPMSCADTPYTQYSTFKVVSDSSCSTTYVMNITLQEYINDNNVTKTFMDGDVFELKSTIFATYSETPTSQPCFVTTYKTPYSVLVYLWGTSFASFASSNVPIGTIRQNSVRIDSSGKLNLAATLSMNTPGKLTNFSFVSSTAAGVSLTIAASINDNNCGLVSGGPSCSYALTVTSAAAASDFSGSYVFMANLYRSDNDQNVLVNIGFSLQYATPTPPPVSNVNFTTSVGFYDANYATPKTVFTELDEAWVLNAIVQQITVPGRALTVQNAYLCCMKDRAPMPAYDPANGQNGCQTQTSAMDIWAQLVNNEVPLVTQYSTKTRPLPFIDSKTGFSFSVLPLVGQDRLCYLQVQSYLKAKSRASVNTYAQDTLLAFAPMQIVPTKTTSSTDGNTQKPTSAAAGVQLPYFLLAIISLLFAAAL